jgi:hypothetical protein
MRNGTTERRILFMPSWRRYLLEERGKGDAVRLPKAGFTDSPYARAIRAFLASDRLAALLEGYGYRLDFFPHIHMRPLFSGISLGENVYMADRADGRSIQDFFRTARIVVTDYSSIAFDVAFLGRALIYWQFDAHDVGGGDHYAKGYFDYERDGFGPVAETLEQLLDALEDLLRKNGERASMYAERAAKTFCFQDDKNCERFFEAIAGL